MIFERIVSVRALPSQAHTVEPYRTSHLLGLLNHYYHRTFHDILNAWAAAKGSVEEVVEGSAVEASETAVEQDSGAAVDLGVTAEEVEAVDLEAVAVVDLVSGMAVGEVREVGITVEQ